MWAIDYFGLLCELGRPVLFHLVLFTSINTVYIFFILCVCHISAVDIIVIISLISVKVKFKAT